MESLFRFHAKSGRLREAKEVFDLLSQRDIAIWNTMLHQCENPRDSREIYGKMPNHDTVTINTLMGEFLKTGSLTECKNLFDQMPHRNTVSWNVMIQGYAQNGENIQAEKCFNSMPNWTSISTNTMLSSHTQHTHVDYAFSFFHSMPERNAVSWNTIVTAFAHKGHLQIALETFHKMPIWTLISSTAVIKLLAENRYITQARYIFQNLPEKDALAWTTMVQAYSESGQLEECSRLFEEAPVRDVVSWACVVCAYAQAGHIHIFHKMPQWNTSVCNAVVSVSGASYARFVFDTMHHRSVVSWAAITEAYSCRCLEEAEKAYSLAPARNLVLETIMVSAYAQAGDVVHCKATFDSSPERNVLTWNALLSGYSHNGETAGTCQGFLCMNLEGVMPTHATFSVVLHSLGHKGLVPEARQVFLSMGVDYCVFPILEHYNCMVDALGRARRFSEAQELIETMPVTANHVTKTMLWNAQRCGEMLIK